VDKEKTGRNYRIK